MKQIMLFNNMTVFETHFTLNFFTPRAVALQLQSSFMGGELCGSDCHLSKVKSFKDFYRYLVRLYKLQSDLGNRLERHFSDLQFLSSSIEPD